jgi:hypothetical protein
MRTFQTEVTLPYDLAGEEREEILEMLRGSSEIELKDNRIIVTFGLCCGQDLYDLAMDVVELREELDSYWPGLGFDLDRPVEIPSTRACCGRCQA